MPQHEHMAGVTKESARRWWQSEALIVFSTSQRSERALLATVETALPPSLL